MTFTNRITNFSAYLTSISVDCKSESEDVKPCDYRIKPNYLSNSGPMTAEFPRYFDAPRSCSLFSKWVP